jgi:nicotinamide-nucleotide amidase
MLEVFLGTVRRSAESRVLRTTGLAESTAQIAAARALEGHDGVELAVLASPSLVDILLYDDGAAAEGLDLAAETVARALGDHCYSTDGSSLAEVVVRTAAACSSSLALAESCTGGMIASALTDVPGSSVAFRGGVVAYANEAKMGLLDVSGGILDSVGAVSAECAAAMAEGARARFGSAIGLSTTGIAGPDGGSEDKPVGTVYLALATEGKTTTFLRRFSGDRDVVRTRTMVLGLDILRRHLLGLPLPGDGS